MTDAPGPYVLWLEPGQKLAPWHDPTVRWVCEEHPDLEFPHDDCPGPGMPEDTPENRAKGYTCGS